MNEQEGYTHPGTHILKNKANTRDLAALQRFEHGTAAVRIQEPCEDLARGRYDLAHLQVVHKQVFRDVYEWASKVHKMDIAEGPTGDQILFTFKEDIPQKTQEIQPAIKEANYLRGMDKEQFNGKMVGAYAGVNETHPFREGNGHMARESIKQPTKDAGRQLDYSRVDRQTWNEAIKESARGNLEPMREVLYEITAVEWTVAFDKLVICETLAKHLELDGTYRMLRDAHRAGQDVAYLRAETSKEPHSGRPVDDGAALDESK